MVNSSRFDWFFRPHLPDEDLPLSAELRFAEALAELPAIERSALALSEIGGLGTDEIAQRLGTDVAVVRKVLTRARSSVRTTLAARSRRGLTALLPLQNWWNGGSSAPLVRTAGAVAAAVIGTGVAIGGAAADQPRPVLLSPDPPVVRELVSPREQIVPGAPTPAAVNTPPAEKLQYARGGAGAAALRPEADRYGDIGARPGENAARPPHAPVARGDEPEIGARPAPPVAERPGLSTTPLDEPPPHQPPPPFPTPYPVPVPVPLPVPVPVPVPAPLPPVELPVEPSAAPAVPVPATPAPPLPAVPPLAPLP